MSNERRTKSATTVALADVQSGEAEVTRLASRPGGVRVVDADNRTAFRLVVPSTTLTD
jgi:hypothetical protein